VKNIILLFIIIFLFTEWKKHNFCIFLCREGKSSGSVGVQGWNGELGGWMVSGRSIGLLDKFPALRFFFELDFEFSVVSIGDSCRMHRVSCKMQNFQNK